VLKTILVAVDSSPLQAAILDQAAELAILSGAKVHVVCVVDPTFNLGVVLGHSHSGTVGVLSKEVDEVLNASCGRLSDRGVPCQTHAVSGLVTEQINLLATEIRADMIVMGHRYLTWMQRIFEKSVGHDLLDRAPCNVLIVMEGADGA